MPRFDLTRLSGFNKPENLSKIKNLTGKKFHQLTVIGLLGVKERRAFWLCLCDCGNFQIVASNSLPKNTKSCGCRRVTVSRAKATIHGYSHTKIYYRWQGMLGRCYDPNDLAYSNYGGRGITVYARWHSFIPFLNDVGFPPTNKHSLDRINNEGNYEPGNVRWATDIEQGSNKRNNHHVTANGETHHLAEWVRRTGINRFKLMLRLKLGWTPEEALEFIPRKVQGKAA